MQNNEAICVNCKAQVNGNFCGHCGQKYAITKLSWTSLFHDLQQRVLGFDGKVLRTIKDMTIRPESVVTSFKEGVRVSYVGPVGYYFLLLTIFVLLISFLNIDMASYGADFSNIFGTPTAEQQAAQQSFQKTAFGNMRVLSFIMIPGVILCTHLLFYKSKLNLIESAVFTFYTQAHPLILSIVGLFFFKFWGTHTALPIMLISSIFYGYVAVRFFKHNHPVWAFIKGVLAPFLGLVIFMILIAIITVIVLSMNPEAMKEIMNAKP